MTTDYFNRFTFSERVKITGGQHNGKTGDYLQTRYAILIDGCYGKQVIHALPKHVIDDNPTPEPALTPEDHEDRSRDIQVGDVKIKDGQHSGCKGDSSGSCIAGRVKRRKRKQR